MYLIDFINSTMGMNPDNTLFIDFNSKSLAITDMVLKDNLLILTSIPLTNALTLVQFKNKISSFPEKTTLVFKINNTIQKIWGYRIIAEHQQLHLK